jgi:hypothetical protein
MRHAAKRVTDRAAPCQVPRASVPRSWRAGERFTAIADTRITAAATSMEIRARPDRCRHRTDLPLVQVCAASFFVPVAGLHIAKIRVLAGYHIPRDAVPFRTELAVRAVEQLLKKVHCG